MIPEAVLKPESKGFRIFLQSNFANAPGMRLRRRFSLAHEIAHTLFYELRDGSPSPVRGAPRSDRLESACHQGAGLLLVPQGPLRRELSRMDHPIGPEGAVELARKFDVSLVVMLRRLDQAGTFDSARNALVLARTSERGHATIEFAPYPPWLKVLLPNPRPGTEIEAWLRNYVGSGCNAGGYARTPLDQGFESQTALGLLRASRFDVTRSQCIFRLGIDESSAAPA